MSPEKFQIIQALFPMIAIIVTVIMGAWVLTTWMRIKNGYPLDGAWGQKLYPKRDGETVERVRLISQENAQLRAELGSVKDRLANVERIVTDGSHQLDREISALRDRAN